MKYFVLALLMFAAGVAITRIEPETPHVTPIVRLRTTGGLFITLVQSETKTKKLCTEANDRFVQPLIDLCPACEVLSSDCAEKLVGIEGALVRGEPVPVHTVGGAGFRAAVLGPPSTVNATCQALAVHMVKGGVNTATCRPPSGAS